MRTYPALELTWPTPPSDEEVGLVLALADEANPTAMSDVASGVRLFFTRTEQRDRARATLETALPHLTLVALDVPDEDWAARSQASITPVTVGRIVVAPPWAAVTEESASGGPIQIVIEPSMGFGTGHHASTRLCLGLLQSCEVAGRAVLDVGTGSGVLAIAAWRLGARPVVGIDVDQDALTSAAENVDRNGARVDLREADIVADVEQFAGRFDGLFANLTGGLLCRAAVALTAALRPGGFVIASGFQTHEREDVTAALAAAGAALVTDISEEGWVGARFAVDSRS